MDAESPVHQQCMTVNETCLGAAQPKYRIGNFLRLAEASGRNVAHQFCFQLGIAAHQFLGHRGADNARTYGINTDMLCCIVDGSGACQPDDGMLAGDVSSLPRKARHATL